MEKPGFIPNPPVGRIMIEGPFQKKKEQKANDALYLKGLADHLESNFRMFDNTCDKLREIAKRLK